MPRVDRSIDVPLSPECTWDLMTDLKLRPSWDNSILDVQRGKLDHHDSSKGLSYRAPLFGRISWNWEGVYASFDPPYRSAVRMVWGSRLRPFRSLVGTWVLSGSESFTNVRMIVSFEPRLRLPTLARLMGYRVKIVLGRSLINLRDLSMNYSCSEESQS